MSSSDFKHAEVYARGASKKLIVFLHGYGPFAKKHLSAIAEVITGDSITIRSGWSRLTVILKVLFFLGCTGLVVESIRYLLHHDWSSLPHKYPLLFAAAMLTMLLLGFVVIAGSFLLISYIARFGGFDYQNMGGIGDSLGAAIDAISKEEPDADLLIPFYQASFFSNADPFWLASRLEDLIARTDESRSQRGQEYEQIVLIGHSIGALLVRKAYVYGMGATEDHPVSSGHQQKPKHWCEKVERLILFAPMNRGWDIHPKPRHMGVSIFLFYWLMLVASTLTRTAGLLRSLRRGTVFISNLRIQWARLCRLDGVTVAPMIMLLGDVDDLVSQDDHQDVTASANFIHIPVPSSGHGSIVRLHAGKPGQIRTECFRKALSYTIEALKKEFYHSTKEIRDSKIVMPKASAHASDDLKAPGPIVFIMHGIRDHGHWTREVGIAIKAANASVRPITSSYGYFPILRFLFLNARQGRVRLFMDWYADVVAANGDQDISYVGHSNGTFIAAAALRRYATVKFKNVALLASIVPCDFPWDMYIASGRVTALRTDLSADDAVVALFGGFFETLRQNLHISLGSFGEIGSSGFDGFHDSGAHTNEPKYFFGGHGGPIKPGNHTSLADFAISGASKVGADLLVPGQSRWVSFLGRFSVPLAGAICLAILIAGYGVSLWIHDIWNVPMLIPALCYTIFIFAVLLLF